MKRTLFFVPLLFSACISSVVLEEDTSFYGVDFLAGTEMRFQEEDGVIHILSGTLAHDSVIDEVYLKGEEEVAFYPSGALKSGTLAQAAEFNDTPFPRNVKVEFFESGEIMSGWLEIDTAVNDRLYTGGTYIEFYETGEVRIGTLAEFIPGIEMMQSEVNEIELQFDIFGTVIRPLGY